jgi:hypothetical protein
VKKGHLNQEDYIVFLKDVKRKLGPERFALMFDGLNIHKSNRSYNWYNNNRVLPLLTEAWIGSKINPIETCFSLIKRSYYREKLRIGCNPNFDEHGKNLNDLDIEAMIHSAFTRYKDFDFGRIMRSGVRKWNERLAAVV